MKIIVLIISLLFLKESFAQTADFILFKKRSRTIASYFAGTNIGFVTTSGNYLQANITQIKNDTLFLKEYVVRKIQTQLGFYIIDTVNTYLYKYHYNEIKSIAKSGTRFDIAASGGVLMGGGVLLMAGSAVVYLADNKRFSPELMAAAAVLTGIGYLLSRVDNSKVNIGKKYTIVYVQANNSK